MRDLILALIIFLLAFLLFGKRRAEKWAKFRQAKRDYQKANENFVRSFWIKQRLDRIADLNTRLILLGIVSVFILMTYFITPFGWSGVLLAVLGNFEPLSKPMCLILFGKESDFNTLFDAIKKVRTNRLHKKYCYNICLLPVYKRKRDESRKQLISMMSELRKF